MKTTKQILCLLCSLVCACGLSAQTITGKLTDEQNQPLPYANVVILSLPDSAFVNGTVSAEDGSFSLNATTPDQIIRITSVGYTTVYKPVQPADLGTVRLIPDTQLLNEVVIKGDLPRTRVKGDAMVTTVTGSILEKAGTGNDLLNKIPGVSAEEGSVNVFGSGAAEIYINGRKMRDASELEQLESNNIKSVEVVRNPGARYDASVAAVIRIFTKKPEGEGFGFNNRTGIYYRYNWSELNQFNFNYRKGGFDLGGMILVWTAGTKIIRRSYRKPFWKKHGDRSLTFHRGYIHKTWPPCCHSTTSSTNSIRSACVTTTTILPTTAGTFLPCLQRFTVTANGLRKAAVPDGRTAWRQDMISTCTITDR